jgi:hypothetical protein
MHARSGILAPQSSEYFSSIDRLRPIQPLPTDRISPENQLRILRAWASVSNEGKRAATVNEVADNVRMVSSTVAMTNPFFSSIGLLKRLAVGTYIPSRQVVAYFNAYAKNPETAGAELAQVFQDAWFGQVIMPKLKFSPMGEKSVLSALEDASGAGQDQNKALIFILYFLELVQIVERNGDQIKLMPLWSTPPQLVPSVSFDGSNYCVTVRVDSKILAEHLKDLFISLSALTAGKV